MEKTIPDTGFEKRWELLNPVLRRLYQQVYGLHPQAREGWAGLEAVIREAYTNRSEALRTRDQQKLTFAAGPWFLRNDITGMSVYVDRFCGDLGNLRLKLDYFEELGVNLIHLMPIFESPPDESDGGYAVSDFRKLNPLFGTLDDLRALQEEMLQRDMYLMLDIVLNHTSDRHEWAEKARRNEADYKDYYYFFPDRHQPDEFDRYMPEVFPESAPGNFTWVPEKKQWVMTVFHRYQWDLNYRNPRVLVEMVDNILYYANMGVDILRIDAPAFIWKEMGTTCQNLPMAHVLLQLIKQCVRIAAPGMALLGEAIVSPEEIMKYFGPGNSDNPECDFAYNATHMALQWDALATGDTRVMLAAQPVLLCKPFGRSWITYTRCHDDIGLGYDDYMIGKAGYEPFAHRRYLKEYYAGLYPGTPARGGLFSVNEKTGDARISGSLASLCGLEQALENNDKAGSEISIRKILLMQAHSFFLGGIPMLFYGDETAHINDYSYLRDPGKSYDNRWMHRPVIDWGKMGRRNEPGTPEYAVYQGTRKLIRIRSRISCVADLKNLSWLTAHNIHVAGYLRAWDQERVYCIFNFSNRVQYLTWYVFKEHGMEPVRLLDHWSGQTFDVKADHEYLVIPPYTFYIMEPVQAE